MDGTTEWLWNQNSSRSTRFLVPFTFNSAAQISTARGSKKTAVEIMIRCSNWSFRKPTKRLVSCCVLRASSFLLLKLEFVWARQQEMWECHNFCNLVFKVEFSKRILTFKVLTNSWKCKHHGSYHAQDFLYHHTSFARISSAHLLAFCRYYWMKPRHKFASTDWTRASYRSS